MYDREIISEINQKMQNSTVCSLFFCANKCTFYMQKKIGKLTDHVSVDEDDMLKITINDGHDEYFMEDITSIEYDEDEDVYIIVNSDEHEFNIGFN